MTLQPEDLRRFLPLYIGCEVMVTRPESASVQMRLTGISIDDMDSEDEMFSAQVFEGDGPDAYEGEGNILVGEEEVQPILRPLSSMTEEDYKEMQSQGLGNYIRVEDWLTRYNDGVFDEFSPKMWLFLLSKHFDLFNLIPSGLAIDKTTMK